MQQAKAHNTTVAPTFSEYWERNIAVIPENIFGVPVTLAVPEVIDEKTKKPKLGFSHYYTFPYYKPSADEILTWDLELEQGCALITGEPSGIIEIDLDNVTDAERDRAIELLGYTPCQSFGTKGRKLYYKYNGEKNCTWEKVIGKDERGKDIKITKAELISTKRKTTIPPSLHRKSKKPYKWIGEPLINCYDRLPTLPTNYQELLDSLFSIIRAPEREYHREDYDFKPSYNDAVEALNYCDANCNNDDWIRIGMAFRSEVGDAGFDDFNAWSSKGKSYDRNSIRSRWRSFNSSNISYGTLIYYAKQGGYRPPERERGEPIKVIRESEWTAKRLENYAKQVRESTDLPEFYTNAPHHIKEICDWIVTTARYPQPLITLGAVCAFIGFYMDRSFKYKGIKGNMYNINLARSTHGKEHIMQCIRGLARELGLDDLYGGAGATADTAIFKKLDKNQGIYAYIIDEFQVFMKVLSAKKSSNAREAGLVSFLLKAYTSKSLDSVDYADDEKNKSIKIKDPVFSLISCCTPEPFFDAISSAEAFNGMVGRFTIFEAQPILPQRNRNHNPEADIEIPSHIINLLKDIKANRIREFLPDGSFVYATTTQVVESPEGYELAEKICDEIDDKRREYDKTNPQMALIIGRIFELIKKYALIASRGKQIEPEHILWAKSVADYNLGIMLTAAGRISDNDFEKKKNQAYDFILKRGGVVTQSEFTSGCRVFNNGKERQDVLKDLEDAGKIEKKKDPTSTKPKLVYEIIG